MSDGRTVYFVHNGARKVPVADAGDAAALSSIGYKVTAETHGNDD